MNLVYVVDWLIYIVLALQVVYLLIFALASFRKWRDIAPSIQNPRRMAILIPAYREDAVIFDTVNACFAQCYPEDKFEIVVISDKMSEETNERLAQMPVRVVTIMLEKSSKAKSLDLALQELNGFDVAIVLDADNIIEPHYLQKVNAAFHAGHQIVQTHRTAKNLNTHFAILDAISEEINNTIFRKGHYNLGLSSALIGSGMAFEFNLYKGWMNRILSVSGEDKELEHLCLSERYKIAYLDNAIVLDEKIQRASDFQNQRKRWLSAQVETLVRFFPDLLKAIRERNLDFCDKVFQMMLLPRILLLGVVLLCSMVISAIELTLSLKWWGMFAVLVIVLIISTPGKFFQWKVFRAMLSIPSVFLLMTFNLFKLKGAGQTFIHTPHGIDE